MKTLYIKKIILSLALVYFFILNNKVYGQEIDNLSLSYYQQELYVNPAFAGSQGFLSSTFSVKRKWTNIDNSPNTQNFQVHTPFFNNKVGVGLSLNNQRYGITDKMNFNFTYAYRIALNNSRMLSLGLQLGLNTLQHRYADAKSFESGDPLLRENTGVLLGGNFGIGAYYYAPKYYIGFSIPHFIDNTIKDGSDNKLNKSIDFEKLPFYLTGGYVFSITKNLDLKPSTLLHYSQQHRFRFSLDVTAFLNQRFWLGAFLRSKNEFGGNIGMYLFDYLTVSYSYNTNYGQSYVYRGSANEITIGFIWSKDSKKLKLNYF